MKRDEKNPERPQRDRKVAARRPRVGIALGAGAARGWTHIGVLSECLAQGLVPDVVVGTSIGAVVGGSFAGGKFAEIESFARGLTRRTVFSLMDISFNGGGLLGGNRLKRLLERDLAGLNVESLPVRFAAVATEIGTGHEIWLTRGPLADAIRASYALPGVFEPVRLNGRWLFDGALVNPVPVTVCRAFGVDVVIAVNLSETLGRGAVVPDGDMAAGEIMDAAMADPEDVETDTAPVRQSGPLRGLLSGLGDPAALVRRQFARRANGGPGIGGVMVDAFNIVQDRIARSRLAGDPPDVMITPKLGRIGLFDFHRADEMIGIGREATRRAMGEINELVAPRVLA